MKYLEKVYIPVTAKEAAKNGVTLISTHKVTVDHWEDHPGRAKLELTDAQHLKEERDMVLIDRQLAQEILRAALPLANYKEARDGVHSGFDKPTIKKMQGLLAKLNSMDLPF
jgi:hypothetical protein